MHSAHLTAAAKALQVHARQVACFALQLARILPSSSGVCATTLTRGLGLPGPALVCISGGVSRTELQSNSDLPLPEAIRARAAPS